MNRRYFIKAATISALVLPFCSHASDRFDRPVAGQNLLHRVGNSIKAEFGSGFELIDLREVNGSHHANIRHLENNYLVASTDLRRWEILRSDVN